MKKYREASEKSSVGIKSKLTPLQWLHVRFYGSIGVVVSLPVIYIFTNSIFISLFFFLLFSIVYIYSTVYKINPVFPFTDKDMDRLKEPFVTYNISDPCPPYRIFIGNDSNNIPIAIPLSQIKQHMLIVGATGSGKTTTIRTILDSVLRAGGGACFIDGKADTLDTYMVLYEIIKSCDREEDLLILNLLNPSQSHTFNFLKYGDSDFLSEILSCFLTSPGGDGSYWLERGKTMMRALLSVLVFMRDRKEIFSDFVLNIETIRLYMPLTKMVELMNDDRIPEYHNERPIKVRLKAFLDELGPAWRTPNSPAAAEIVKQHGFCVQQWTAPLDMLAGVYHDIFVTEEPDIDLVDVVQNSRVLVVLLPSLRYAPSTLSALGKMVISCFKITLDAALGVDVEGLSQNIKEDVKSKRPIVPFCLIADEYGSYAVEGADTILAQARSLGMGIIISVQELASLKKADQGKGLEMERTLGNTNIKLCMAIDDKTTAEWMTSRIGETYYMMSNYELERGVFFDSYTMSRNVSWQKDKRIEERDLYSLKLGEGYMVFKDEVRKYKTRYIAPKGIKEMIRIKYIMPPKFNVDELIFKNDFGLFKNYEEESSDVLTILVPKTIEILSQYKLDLVSNRVFYEVQEKIFKYKQQKKPRSPKNKKIDDEINRIYNYDDDNEGDYLHELLPVTLETFNKLCPDINPSVILEIAIARSKYYEFIDEELGPFWMNKNQINKDLLKVDSKLIELLREHVNEEIFATGSNS